MNKQQTTRFIVLLRRCIYFALGTWDRFLNRQSTIVILCYHSFTNDAWKYSVAPALLEKQLTMLKDDGYAFCTIDELLSYIRGKKSLIKKSVLITIDDGYKSTLRAVNVFSKFGIKPVLSVLSDTKKRSKQELATKQSMLTTNDIRMLDRMGWVIASHSATHRNLSETTGKQLSLEIAESGRVLEKKLHKSVRIFTYPRGKYSAETVREVRQAGYRAAFSMDDGFITTHTPIYAIPRIGVNATHSLDEFTHIYSPTVIQFRSIIKRSALGAYL